MYKMAIEIEIPEKYREEVGEFQRRHGNRWLGEYCNNTLLNLPDRRFDCTSYNLWAHTQFGRENTHHREMSYKGKPHYPKENGYSDTFLGQSPRQFFETLHSALAEDGVPLEEIMDLQ